LGIEISRLSVDAGRVTRRERVKLPRRIPRTKLVPLMVGLGVGCDVLVGFSFPSTVFVFVLGVEDPDDKVHQNISPTCSYAFEVPSVFPVNTKLVP
jgi:hypothetical protein